MKLLIDVRTLGQRPSGVGIYIYRFALGLAERENVTLLLATDVAKSEELKQLSSRENARLCTYGKPVGK